MHKHLKIKIHGRVQGVFYRSSARHLADKLGVKGFIRNEPDGAVYAETEGEEENLQKFLEWCRQGSSFSKVKKVEVKEGEFKNFTEFSIL